MDHHPIENIMSTTMENIKDMVDVNTVIGSPVHAADGSTIIPVSRVSFGFVSGGGEYKMGESKQEGQSRQGQSSQQGEMPFAGGTGAGVTVQPMGFLVVSGDQVRMLPAQHYAPVDRIIEMVPQVLTDVKSWLAKQKSEDAAAQGNEGNA